VPLVVDAWMPLPDGADPYTHARVIFPPAPERPAKPPEKVYEPGGVDVRLTPSPATSCSRCATAPCSRNRRGSGRRGSSPGRAGIRRSSYRVASAPCAVAFIERDGALPYGDLDRMHHFDWRITPAAPLG
jgi:hypothetical protein